MEKSYFKAFIRVVKSLNSDVYFFGSEEVLRIPLIEAVSSADARKIVGELYPQFFQNGKVYAKETKDEAQFFYVIVFPLYNYELEQIKKGEWICSSCGHVHENEYVSPPYVNRKLLYSDTMLCQSKDDVCYKTFLKSKHDGIEIPDNINFVKKESLNYIYKVTEKSTGKSYVGKTRNAPFFRWWDHLTKSGSPFGLRLSSTKLSEWTFEVLEELPAELPDSEIFRIESDYIIKFDCISNGYNSVLSNKKSKITNQTNVFQD